MAIERSAGYQVSIGRSVLDPKYVHVRLRKHFWAVDTGSRSRLVAEAGFYADGMTEGEILEGTLRELLRALANDLG